METHLVEKNSFTVVIGSSFTMSGVKDIRAFDEGFLSIETSSGRISVEGHGLKIESLNKDTGAIYVSGDITGVFLAPSLEKKKGILSKLFG